MKSFIFGIFIGFLLYHLIAKYSPYDPTDLKFERKRSGLKYFKDYGTGIEYISNPNGGPLLVREKKK